MSDDQNLTNLKMFKNIKQEFCEIFYLKGFNFPEIPKQGFHKNIDYHDEIFKVLYRNKGNDEIFKSLLNALNTPDNHKLVQLLNSYPFIGNKPYGIALVVFSQQDNEQVKEFDTLLNSLGFNVLCIEGTNGSTDEVKSSLEKADFGGVYMLFDLTKEANQVIEKIFKIFTEKPFSEKPFSEKPKLIVTNKKIFGYRYSNVFFIHIKKLEQPKKLTSCLITLFKDYKERVDIYLFEEFAQNLNKEIPSCAYWCPKIHLIFPKFSERIKNKLMVTG